jgi:hypothetical protein
MVSVRLSPLDSFQWNTDTPLLLYYFVIIWDASGTLTCQLQTLHVLKIQYRVILNIWGRGMFVPFSLSDKCLMTLASATPPPMWADGWLGHLRLGHLSLVSCKFECKSSCAILLGVFSWLLKRIQNLGSPSSCYRDLQNQWTSTPHTILFFLRAIFNRQDEIYHCLYM